MWKAGPECTALEAPDKQINIQTQFSASANWKWWECVHPQILFFFKYLLPSQEVDRVWMALLMFIQEHQSAGKLYNVVDLTEP